MVALPFVLVAMFASRHVMGLHWWSMDAEQILAALLVTLLYYERAGGLAGSSAGASHNTWAA